MPENFLVNSSDNFVVIFDDDELQEYIGNEVRKSLLVKQWKKVGIGLNSEDQSTDKR